jgi:hypothetical protein
VLFGMLSGVMWAFRNKGDRDTREKGGQP